MKEWINNMHAATNRKRQSSKSPIFIQGEKQLAEQCTWNHFCFKKKKKDMCIYTCMYPNMHWKSPEGYTTINLQGLFKWKKQLAEQYLMARLHVCFIKGYVCTHENMCVERHHLTSTWITRIFLLAQEEVCKDMQTDNVSYLWQGRRPNS